MGKTYIYDISEIEIVCDDCVLFKGKPYDVSSHYPFNVFLKDYFVETNIVLPKDVFQRCIDCSTLTFIVHYKDGTKSEKMSVHQISRDKWYYGLFVTEYYVKPNVNK